MDLLLEKKGKKVTNQPLENLKGNTITNQSNIQSVNQPLETQTIESDKSSSNSIFSAENINNYATQIRQQELEEVKKYGIELSQDEYDILNKAISNAENPEDESYRIGTAIQYSKMYNIPIEEAVQKMDTYNQALFGSETQKSPKEWYYAVSDAFRMGTNSIKQAAIGNKMRDAATYNDEKKYELLKQQWDLLEQENAALQDNVPRAWYLDALKYGAMSAPFTVTAAGAGIIGGLVHPAIGKLAAFGVSAYQSAGLEYGELRANGASHEAASLVSTISGGLQGVVEVALGDVPAIATLGKTSATALTKATTKITEQLFKKMHYSGTFKNIAQTVTKLGLDYTGEVLEEGIEEATQNIISEGGKQLTAILSEEYNLDEKTAGQIAKETWESFRGGVLGSLVLGGLPLVVNAKATYKDYNAIKEDAILTQSKESFIDDTKEKINNHKTHVFDGVNEKDLDTVLSNIYDNYSKERKESYAESVDEENNIRESTDLETGTQEMEVDEEGDRINFTGEYRNEEGRIYTEEDENARSTQGEITKGRLLAGDPSRPHNNEESGNRYGYIDYEVKGDTVEIINFKMSPGREIIADELFEDFAEKFAGKKIEWNPKFEKNTQLKQQIIENNPNGKKAGLNYFNNAEEIRANKETLKLTKDFRKWLPNWKNEQIAAGVALTKAAANAKDLSLRDYVDTYFQNGQMFTSVEGAGLNQIVEEGTKVYGASEFDDDSRAIIYVSKFADFNTFSHELAHVFRKTLDDTQLEAASKAYNIQDKNEWTREEEERFADGFVDYLRTGKAPTKGLKELFRKAAQFIGDIIRGLQGQIDLSDDIKAVYDSLIKDDGTGLAQALKAVQTAERQETRILRNETIDYVNEQQEAEQNNDSTETENEENVTENEENVITETVESIQEETIKDETLSNSTKAETVIDTEGFTRTENQQENKRTPDVLFQAEQELDKEYFEAIEKGDMDKVEQMVKDKAAANGFDDALEAEGPGYTIRTKPAPKKTIKMYKTFFVDTQGRPSALFIGNSKPLPMNVWLDAKEPFHFTDPKNGLEYVPTVGNPNNKKAKATGDEHEFDDATRQKLIDLGYLPKNSKRHSITAVAYRPGWHGGDLPYFPQGGKKLKQKTNWPNIHRWNQVVFEIEIDADFDYTETARSQEKAIKADGTVNNRKADLQYMPEGGYYYYTTNTSILNVTKGNGVWVLTDSIKIVRALSQEECDKILQEHGLPVQEWESMTNPDEIGTMDLALLGYTGPTNDAARKTLAPITYDDDGNIIPLSERFNKDDTSILYQKEKDEKEEVRKRYENTDKWLKAPNGKDTNLTTIDNWLEVRTPSFKKWFGDWENDPAKASKVLDENGEPLIVYHGTSLTRDQITPNKGWNGDTYIRQQAPFTIFKGGNYSDLIFTSVDYDKAKDIASIRSMAKENGTEDGYVYDLYLNIRNPFNPDDIEAVDRIVDSFNGELPALSYYGYQSDDNFITHENAKKIISSKSNNWMVTETPEFISKIKENGYDGIIGYDDAIKYFAAMKPIQLKSAWENTGTFSDKNPSILFQKEYNPQIEELRQRYENTDKWLKAPNGKNTNLSEREWLLVRTDNFKKWFGNWEDTTTESSNALDNNGEPKVMYHQTASSWIDVFNTTNNTSSEFDDETPNGIFFKSNPNDIGLQGKNQMSLFLNTRNTLVFKDRTEARKYWRDNVTGYKELDDKYQAEDKKYEVLFDVEDARVDKWYEDNYQDIIDGKISQEELTREIEETSDKILEEWKEATNPLKKQMRELITNYINIDNKYDSVRLELDAGSFGRKTDATIVFNPNQIKSTNNMGQFNPLNPSILFQIAGEKGAKRLDKYYNNTERMDNLVVAKEMRNANKDANTIKMATGWEYGADGKWKYEINSSKYIFDMKNEKAYQESHPEYKEVMDALINGDPSFNLADENTKKILDIAREHSTEFRRRMFSEGVKLEEILHSDELYKAYPELKKYNVIFEDEINDTYDGYQQPGRIVIVHQNTYSFMEQEFPRILIHEVQHAIQDIEGFAKGGNQQSRRYQLNRLYNHVNDLDWYVENLNSLWDAYNLYNFVAAYRKYIENPKSFLKTGWYYEYGSFGYSKDKNVAKQELYEDIQKMYKGEKEKFDEYSLMDAMKKSDEDLKESIKRTRKNIKDYTKTIKNYGYYESENKIEQYEKLSDTEFYNNLAGEVEARNVSKRRRYDAEKRAITTIEETADVTTKDQIVLYQLVTALDTTALSPEDAGKNRLQQLAIAKSMEIAQQSAVEIEKNTGWKRNTNNEWQFNSAINIDELNKEYYKSAVTPNEQELSKAILDITADVDKNDKKIMAESQRVLFQKVYHGTSANFEKFSIEHALEGSGSQNYGSGLYFTGDESIAEKYAKKAKAKTNKYGIIYEADIPEGNYLDWDGFINQEQLDKVATAYAKDSIKLMLNNDNFIQDVVKEYVADPSKLENTIKNINEDGNPIDGGYLYYILMTKASNFYTDKNDKNKLVSKWLADAGIDGVKYSSIYNGGKHEDVFNYVVFDDSNIKVLHRTLFQAEKENKTMVGIHNLSESKLRHAIKMGGLANPSMAVIDIENNPDFTDFGSITLIAPKYLIDKKEGKNAGTYAADIYSPRYPNVDISITQKGDKQIDNLLSDINNVDMRIAIRDKIEDSIESSRDVTSTGLQVPFLIEKGDTSFMADYVPHYKESDRNSIKAWKIDFNRFITEQKDKAEILSKYYMAMNDDFLKETKAVQKKMFKLLAEEDDPKSLSYNILNNFLLELREDENNAGKTNVRDAINKAHDIVYDNYDAEFREWANKKLKTIETKERLYNGKDEDGADKFLSHTLANVSRIMKQQDLIGGEVFHDEMGTVRAKLLSPLNTLKKIKNERDKIVKHEVFEAVVNDLQDTFDNVMHIVGDGDTDMGESIFIDTIRSGYITPQSFMDYINENYGIEITLDDAREALALADDLKQMPTEYFETKFTRPVYINEFTAALIPNDLPQDLKDYLSEQGLMLEEYDRETGRLNHITSLPTTIGQKRNILFQTEKEMIDEAASFDSWEEWKDFTETFADEEEETPRPSNADAEWYEKTWKAAKHIEEENVKELTQEEQEEQEDTADKEWYAMLSSDNNLDTFLLKLAQLIYPNTTEQFTPADAEEEAYLNNLDALRNRADNETSHNTFHSAILSARRDLNNDRDTVALKPKHRKSLMTLIKNSSRDYRDLYADVMQQKQYKVTEGFTTAELLKNRESKRHHFKIVSPDVDIEALTPEKRRQYAQTLDAEDIRSELLDGTMKMDIKPVQDLIHFYDDAIAKQQQDINKLKELNTEANETILGKNIELEKKEKELKEKIAARRQIEGVRDIKIRLIKNVNKRVDFKRVAYDQGKKIIAIQTLFHPILRQFVNKFINSEGTYIRDAYSRYRTDFEYRDKLKRLATEKGGRNLSKVLYLFDNSTFDKWTEEERELVARTLPRTDWIDALNLDELQKKRAGSLQLDLQSEETQKLLREALPDDILALLTAKDLREWTLEEMEDLVAVVNELYKEGKEVLAAKKEAALQRAENYQSKIRKALKDSGIVFNADDTPEEHERKVKAQEKFVKNKLPKILGEGNAIKGTLAASAQKESVLGKILHGYGDANVRRVARILDNGTEGVNTTLLYYRENECFNREQRAMQKRTENINKQLEDNNITLEDLYKSYEVTFPDGVTQSFTADELLFMEAANKDDTSRAAVACGNMYDETFKQNYRGSTKMQLEYEKLAYQRFEKCLEAAAKLPENVRQLLTAIETDYTNQYEEMNKVSIEEYNEPVWRVDHYVPLNRLESNGDENANRLKEDLLAASGSYAKTFGWVDRGMTKKRVEISPANQRPVQLGLYSTWTESMQRTEHFIAYAAYLRDLNRIYKGRTAGTIRQLMENRYGRGMVGYVDQYINETANPNALEPKTHLDRIVRALRGKTAPAYLSWKMSSIIKQLCTSPWPYMQYISPWKYASAAIEFATNKDVRTAIRTKSAFMNSRVYDPIIDIVNEQKQKATDKKKYNLTQFEAMGMKGLEMVDWCCVAPGWLAIYKDEYARISSDEYQDKLVADAKKKYESYSDVQGWDWVEAMAEEARMTESEIEAKAVEKADDITRMCQPSSRITDLSPIFKEGNEMAKIFLQFTTSLNVIWQNIRYDMPNAIKHKEWKQVIGTIAGYTLAGITMGLITSGLGGEDDEPEQKAGQLAFYALSQFTDSVPVIGSMVSNTVESSLTKKWNYTSSNNLFPISTKMINGVKAISKEDWDKAASSFGEATGLAFGLPVSGIKELLTTAGIGHDEGFYPQAELGRRPER